MTKLALIITCFAVTTGVAAETFPLVSLIFEYTVARDGTRQNIRIVKIEQPVTHKDLSSALTQSEKSRGIRNITNRPRVAAKEAGHKLYEVAIFDLRNRHYVTDE
jgi:hypothetical protein